MRQQERTPRCVSKPLLAGRWSIVMYPRWPLPTCAPSEKVKVIVVGRGALGEPQPGGAEARHVRLVVGLFQLLGKQSELERQEVAAGGGLAPGDVHGEASAQE